MEHVTPHGKKLADWQATHIGWQVTGKVATLTLNRPERKNPLTFESYAEIRDLFRALSYDKDIKAIVLTGAGGNFSSGGDVFEIIGPLLDRDMPGLLDFTRMTGECVKAMRAAPQTVIAAIDGVCVGAGAILAMAADLRVGTERAKIAFLFNKVGLAGCDMGACAILPRLIGQGRAAELLYTGRVMPGSEAHAAGFLNRLAVPEALLDTARALAEDIANGPTFANAMTKRMLNMEWAMSVDEAIEAEALAQAVCMETQDFRRAYEAFAEKRPAVFKGN